MNPLYLYLYENSRRLSILKVREIPDFNTRIVTNVKNTNLFDIPYYIETLYDLLIYCDPDNGICKFNGCKNKKKIKSGRKWILNDFCCRNCADADFSEKQKLNNTSHRMTDESKNSMKIKLSSIVRKKIKCGIFTPGVNNSLYGGKIEVLIKNKIVKVRSSWEALFYIINPDFLYENIRIEYLDSKKNKLRNYIVDFCDMDKKIIYEIKPRNKKEDCLDKMYAADEWCKINGYKFNYIDENWISANYRRDLLNGQPESDKIANRIEKAIKIKNYEDKKN
jgi:hypothetical protein